MERRICVYSFPEPLKKNRTNARSPRYSVHTEDPDDNPMIPDFIEHWQDGMTKAWHHSDLDKHVDEMKDKIHDMMPWNDDDDDDDGDAA